MILDFGYICMEMRTQIECDLNTCEFPIAATHNTFTPGGSATLQAIAAARCGAQVSLSGAIGNDIFAKTILDTLRREGIRGTSIATSECQTDITTHITAPDRNLIISSSVSNAVASEEQIADHTLNTRTLLLIQNDFPVEKNWPLLQRAKQKDCYTSLAISHTKNITPEMLELIDTFIINGDIAEELAKQWEVTRDKLPHYLSEKYKLLCIITENHGLNGALLCTKNLEETTFPALKNNEVTDTSACFDVFCGSFNACIQAAKPIKTALTYAQSATALTAQKQGGYASIPYLGDIEDYIENSL